MIGDQTRTAPPARCRRAPSGGFCSSAANPVRRGGPTPLPFRSLGPFRSVLSAICSLLSVFLLPRSPLFCSLVPLLPKPALSEVEGSLLFYPPTKVRSSRSTDHDPRFTPSLLHFFTYSLIPVFLTPEP